ncbi:MAG TPA: FkbM family methyltransferase [Prolixibacteraceae bacterium]|jgi:FkbM family methyltransferase|nr:FkbM family methyltransferase [Prolixibacteraceae bacterium]HOG96591.1 FkbM family methyltransferase [Prolixibacteraceae bacterium]
MTLFKNQIRNVKNKPGEMLSKTSWSQEGEDMILSRIFEDRESGFYVDIGAHHPQRFSNTMFFYQKGWRGINIDALPGSMGAFHKERPGDINLEVPVSDKEEVLTFYIFNDPALSTFSKALTLQYQKKEEHFVVSEKQLKTKKLETIFNENLIPGCRIDFLSVDVEGFELNVLKSNNWNLYKPEIVLTEFLDFEIKTFLDSELYQFMQGLDYRFYAKTTNTVFFKLSQNG